MSSLITSEIFLSKKKKEKYICSICNHSFSNKSHLTRHIKKTHNKETEGFLCKYCNKRFYHKIHEKSCLNNPLVQYEKFIKENGNFLEEFIKICDNNKVKNLNYFILLFNEVYDNEILSFKNFLSSLIFISKEHYNFYLNNYYHKIKIEKDNLLKFFRGKNIENDININNEFIYNKEELEKLIEKFFISKKLNKNICLHCLKYFNNVGDHIFRIREKKSTCCEIARNNILNGNNLNEQLDFFVELIKLTRRKIKEQSNEEIKENIRKLLKKNNKINDNQSIIDFCKKIYCLYFRKNKKYSLKKNKIKKNIKLEIKKEKILEKEFDIDLEEKTEYGTEKKLEKKKEERNYFNNEEEDINIHQLTIKNHHLDDLNYEINNNNSEFELNEDEKINESYILIIKSILEKKSQLFNDNIKNIPSLYQKKILNLIITNNPFNDNLL